ncbi:hypothetical protein PybrP1_008605 [[Pythium] brassicae (nom. inval.)]|nr:hypothetical protein PybrP1_008605 [[Pythium] brassicae (nom. inval.)]
MIGVARIDRLEPIGQCRKSSPSQRQQSDDSMTKSESRPRWRGRWCRSERRALELYNSWSVLQLLELNCWRESRLAVQGRLFALPSVS